MWAKNALDKKKDFSGSGALVWIFFSTSCLSLLHSGHPLVTLQINMWSCEFASPSCQASSYALVTELISVLWGTTGGYRRGLGVRTSERGDCLFENNDGGFSRGRRCCYYQLHQNWREGFFGNGGNNGTEGAEAKKKQVHDDKIRFLWKIILGELLSFSYF